MAAGERKNYTIEDIARELGVSKTTVSRAISGKGRISQATRERVMQFIEAHDYRPNVMAKGLAQRKTYNIALLLPVCLSLLMLKCLDMTKNAEKFAGRLCRSLILLAAIIWVSILRCEYGLCMVLLTAVFYLSYEKNVWKTVLGALISLMYVTGPLAFYGIWCYNGKRKDRFPKYVYYVFYPAHLLVLGVLKKMIW